ncbi:MAG: 50S ribosomal protein L23 [Candidatus Taylorbacteria bacterium]
MALFGTQKKTVEKKAPKVAKTSVPAVVSTTSPSSVASVILRPRITEKSGMMSQSGVYTFEVAKSANKNTIAHAVKALYKVTPVRVAIINSPAKNVFVRGRRGVVSGVKKAVVTLKKGDKIDFV